MPDINGKYLGDQSGVLPDNTSAFIHFSDQFAQQEQQRRAKEALQQKAEQERLAKVQSAIHSGIYNKDYLTNDATNPIIRENMDNLATKAMQIYKDQGRLPRWIL